MTTETPAPASDDTTDGPGPTRGFGDTFSSGDDDSGADHGSPGWIGPFVSWARGEVDTLDFGGASVPRRVQHLLTGEHRPDSENAGSHDAEDPTD